MAQCFTVDYPATMRVLMTPVFVTEAFDPAVSPPHPNPNKFMAIWDTGATGSVISQQVVDACGIAPTGMTEVHGVHGKELSEVYLINLQLLNGVNFHSLRVTKGILGGAQMLIGMDVISCGDFVVTNYNGKTAFSFRMPSTERIDWVKQKPLLVPHKQSRNDKCACKSGKKYKDCCGKIA